MVCNRVSNLLSAFLDRELGGYEMLAVQRHLSHCARCRGEHEALAHVRRLLSSLPAAELRPGSEERMLARYDAMPRPEYRWAFLQRSARRQRAAARPVRTSRIGIGHLAWASVAGVALAAGLALMVTPPRHADAVVAVVRPELDLSEVQARYTPDLPEVWPRGLDTSDEWPARRPTAYQLIELKRPGY